MSDAGIQSFDDHVLATSIGLIDALLDACVGVEPGRDAARTADELTRLGDGAAVAALELTALIAACAPTQVRTAA